MKKFVDEVKIFLKSGHGGPGCVSFASSFRKPRGGPDGGEGGSGGHVIFRVNSQLDSLEHLQSKKRRLAENGKPGNPRNRKGARGLDLVIEVPPGTLVCDKEKKESVDLICGEYRLLNGGRGGKGNSHYKSSRNQAPQQFQKGESGEQVEVFLQLKLMTDVGVIGCPNVGKSTLVSVLTGTKTRIGDYPFSTLKPQLAKMRWNHHLLSFTDTPGLVSGSSRGLGLGIGFLQHLERARVLVHLLDVSDLSNRDVWDDYVKVNGELEAYDIHRRSLKTPSVENQKRNSPFSHGQVWADFVPLVDRPQVVVFNKVDEANSKRKDRLEEVFRNRGVKVIGISATKDLDKKTLMDVIVRILSSTKDD